MTLLLSSASCGEDRPRSEARPPSAGEIGKGAAFLGAPATTPRPVGPFRGQSGADGAFHWITPGAFAPAAGAGPRDVASRVLAAYAAHRGLERSAVDAAEVVAVHDAGPGPLVVDLRQTVDGLEVFGHELSILIDRAGNPVAVTGSLAPGIAAGPRAFSLGARDAVAAAFERLTGAPLAPATLRGAPAGAYTRFSPGASGGATGPALRSARAKKILHPGAKKLLPAYYVEIEARTAAGEARAFAYVVSAVDASILLEADLVASEAFSYRVWADSSSGVPFDGPQGPSSSPFAAGQPDGSQFPAIAPSLLTLEAGPISTGDPWLPAGATTTSGNNVDAYADLADPDGFSAGDLRATTSASGTFDYVYDTADEPDASDTQRMAGVVQAFYVTNYLHDWFYDLGFDEAAGNAQLDNFGRGGVAGDPLRVEVQDYSGTDNANMLTPADGAPPRMQMFTWTSRGATAEVQAPGGAQRFPLVVAGFGAQRFSTAPAPLALPGDGGSTAGDACETLTPASLDGNVALVVYSGQCAFTTASQNAQDAGAAAVIFSLGLDIEPSGIYLPGTAAGVTIPVAGAFGDGIQALADAVGTAEVALERLPGAHSGALDSTIVAHEWGHYISNRLVGNGAGLITNQARSLGEGWGDFHALLLMVRAEDALVAGNEQFQGIYPVGAHPLAGGLSNAYYFGIRRVPYSTNMAVDPLTFGHIEEGVALPAGVLYAHSSDGAANAESHASGEVWATMLWECYAGLLRDTGRLTFQEAQLRMSSYLVAAYKLTPRNPTFLEARDALLAVAMATDPADFAVFAQAFARRGAGIDAVAPARESEDHAGVVESFSAGAAMAMAGVGVNDDVVACDGDRILDPGETATVTIAVANTGWSDLVGATATVTSSAPGITIAGDGVVPLSSAAPMGLAYAELQVSMAEGASGDAVWLEVALAAPGADAAAGQVLLLVDRDEIAAASATDGFQALTIVPWSAGGADSGGSWYRVADEQANLSWIGPDHPAINDQWLESPAIEVSSTEPFSLALSHAYRFESSWDGGVIELSTDGKTWSDVSTIVNPGYTGTLNSTSGNPLSGRAAFTGQSAGYPSRSRLELDFGTALAGQTVWLRFRVGSDLTIGDVGWEIDDVEVAGVDALPFVQIAAEDDMCTAGEPDAAPPDASGGGMADAGEPDAGEPDAGEPDAGEPDASLPDAAVPGDPDAGAADAGPDPGADAAPTAEPDAGTTAEPDAGAPAGGDDSGGCGCSASSGGAGGTPLLVGLTLLCLGLGRRRRLV